MNKYGLQVLFTVFFYVVNFFLFYSCCTHLEHRTSVKRFVSLQFLNLRQSVGLLGQGISPSQTQIETHRHASSVIRTHDPSVGVGEDIVTGRCRPWTAFY
jgi:hypothetical protein